MDSTIRRRWIIAFATTLMIMLCMLVSINVTISMAETEPIVSESSYSTFEMESGAQTRTDDKKAIRFVSKISQEQLDALTEDYQVKIVTMITPARYLERNGINNAEGFVKGAEVAMEEVVFSSAIGNLKSNAKDDGYYYFYACLFGIKDNNVTQDFAARSYLVINGQPVAYTDYDKANNISIYEVALGIKENFIDDEYAYANLEALSSGKYSQEYTVTVNGIDGKTVNVTATYGQPLYSFENEISSALSLDGVYYYDGTVSKADDSEFTVSTSITESGLTVTAGVEQITFEEDGDDLVVTGVTDGFYAKSKVVKIPATFNGKTVKSVSANAFTSDVTEIYIPETVTLSANAISGIQPKIVKGDLEFTYKANASKLDYLNYKFDASGNVVFVDEQLDVQYALDSNYIAIPTPNDILEGSDWRNKYEKYIEDISTLNTPELWWKAVDAIKSTIPAEERESVYYVKALNNLDLQIVNIPATFDDGVNGELPIKYIGKDGLGYNANLKKVFATETLTELRGTAFRDCSNLEVAVLPGVKYLADIRNDSGTIWMRENFNGCASLVKLVVGSEFKASGVNFKGSTGGVIRFYIYGENVISSTDLWLNSNYSSNALAREDIYAYRAVCSDKYWQFDENGEPQRNSNEHTYVNGKCKVCGAHKMAVIEYAYDDNFIPVPTPAEVADSDGSWIVKYSKYVSETTDVSTLTTPELWYTEIYNNRANISAEDRVKCYYVKGLIDTTATVISIPATFNDGVHGELPIKYINSNAFENKDNLVKVLATETLTELRGRAFANCNSLKVIVLPGVKYLDGLYKDAPGPLMHSQNFYDCYNSNGSTTKLVVGDGFKWAGNHFQGGTTEAKCYLIRIFVYGTTKSSGPYGNGNNKRWGVSDSRYCFYDATGQMANKTNKVGYWHWDEELQEPVHNFCEGSTSTSTICNCCGDPLV